MSDSQIPFLDLIAPHRELKDELSSVFVKALETAAFIGGPMVEGFERDFAAFCDAEHCVGVGSGTDAVRFALIAAGVKKDAIVITVSNTFIATTEAITQAGARPDFVDIDERTYNMDPEKLREYLEEQCYVDQASGEVINRKLGRPVAAIVPVHLYGQPADMDPIEELAARYHLIVVEDACQAHGAEYYSRRDRRWRKAGSMGKAAAFSFYPGKNLGACGEAGAITTNDEKVAQTVRKLRDHGQVRKYYHDMEGYNGRLDALQAGFLRVKLKHLNRWNEQRREAAKSYGDLLGSTEGIVLPFEPDWSRAVYHLYVVRVQQRQRLRESLAAADTGTGIHYPVPLHLQKAYGSSGYQSGEFSHVEEAAGEIVSLPMYPGLTYQQQKRVAEQIQAFLQTSRYALSAAG